MAEVEGGGRSRRSILPQPHEPFVIEQTSKTSEAALSQLCSLVPTAVGTRLPAVRPVRRHRQLFIVMEVAAGRDGAERVAHDDGLRHARVRDLPKLNVVGSIPITRSRIHKGLRRRVGVLVS